MAIHALTIVNPGAETGDTTGWTARSGGAQGVITAAGHSGTHYFVATPSGTTAKWDQQIDVSAYATAIDADTCAIIASAYHSGFSGDSDSGALYVEFYNTSVVLLARQENVQTDPSTWTLESVSFAVPPNTRYIRVGTNNVRHGGTELSAYWDDFALSLTDDRNTDYPGIYRPRISQFGTYAVVNQNQTTGSAPVKVQAEQFGAYTIAQRKAEDAYILQGGVILLTQDQTSTGLFNLYSHQLGVYVLVKKHGDKRKLRAWTFPQDDHKFYVLQLGNSNGTLIYDQQTQQWAQWKSPEQAFWRGEDGCDWEGFNVACDPLSGKIFQIDPEGRLDYNDDTVTDDTPITSVVIGGTTKRFRTNTPCYMAELAISEGEPPDGIDPETVGISLRSGDTLGWYNHGEILGTTAGEKITVRWYGLGLMAYPGRVFELTDTGYARRIDGLNIEVGDSGSK